MSASEPCVLLGVTGCIAAYKSCEIVRALQKHGVRVKVLMSEHATEFVSATTFRALTHEPVACRLFDEAQSPVHHISLAQECDAYLIAPATANVIAKLAAGIADDLLTTTALATTAPILVAPAMNTQMYEAVVTHENLATLKRRGAIVIEPSVGELACGQTGIGHLADVEDIVNATIFALGIGEDGGHEGDLCGINVLVTAGPTVEPIDAVRFISNYSSGKMGYAIARAASRRGAHVTLVSGPVHLEAPRGVDVIGVKTADEMLKAAEGPFNDADIAVFAAAVSDIRPESMSARKLKKGEDDESLLNIQLVENPDVLGTLANRRHPGQFVIGFSAETDDVVANAQAKLAAKGADMIVANKVGDDLVFGSDENTAFIVDADGFTELDTMSKDALADVILDYAQEHRETS